METATAETLHEELYKDNPTFRNLVVKHQTYEDRLTELGGLTYPSEEEQTEETIIKKKKLLIKDQIYTMLQEHETGK